MPARSDAIEKTARSVRSNLTLTQHSMVSHSWERLVIYGVRYSGGYCLLCFCYRLAVCVPLPTSVRCTDLCVFYCTNFLTKLSMRHFLQGSTLPLSWSKRIPNKKQATSNFNLFNKLRNDLERQLTEMMCSLVVHFSLCNVRHSLLFD
jgi:hypothetical protein